MSFYPVAFQNYAVFSGRASRSEFWIFMLWLIGIQVFVSIVEAILGYPFQRGPFTILVAFVSMIPTLAVFVRRLHDLGRSAWWLLVGLIPLVGYVTLFVIAARGGEPGDNKYGPKPNTEERNSVLGLS